MSTTPNEGATPNQIAPWQAMTINNLAVLLGLALKKLNAPKDVIGAHEDGDTDAVLAFIESINTETDAKAFEELSVRYRQMQVRLSAATANATKHEQDAKIVDWLEGMLTCIYQSKPKSGYNLEEVEVPYGKTLRETAIAAMRKE